LNDDKAQPRERLHLGIGRKRLRYERSLWARVDVFDDGILLRGVEIRGTDDDAPDVGLAVAAFGHEDFRRRPAGGLQLRDVAALELHDDRAVARPAQLRHGRGIDPRVGVDEVRLIR
jgi:hypothetical protein